MINFRRMREFYFRVLIAFFVIAGTLWTTSVIAVSIAGATYNHPIVPTCPAGIGGNHMARAFDIDGTVVNADVTMGLSDGTFRSIPQSAVDGTSSATEASIHAALGDILPAITEGDVLTARLNILDTSAEGFYRIIITFSNNDTPLAQTAACMLTILVTKASSSDGSITTFITIQSSEILSGPVTLNPYRQQFERNVIGGMLPGAVAILLAAVFCAHFISALFGLESVGKGLQFLKHRIFGRPGFAPFLIIEEGKIGMGEEIVKKMGGPAGLVLRQDSAIVTEVWGKLTRVIRGPGFPRLEPFEKIWDMIDLRPQRWLFKVSAITRDGIPITYEVAVKFRVGDTDADIFKAATCKWIRDAERTEPDRLMDWIKRVMLSATEGTMRTYILAHYKLDELLDVSVRRQIRDDLIKSLTATAANDYGVIIMEVTLHDVEFEGQVLQEWCKTWRARRDIEVQKIEADERVQGLQMRKRAENQVRQEMLYRTIRTLSTLSEKDKEISLDYVLFSFIKMVEHTAFAQKVFIAEDSLSKLDRIKENLL